METTDKPRNIYEEWQLFNLLYLIEEDEGQDR